MAQLLEAEPRQIQRPMPDWKQRNCHIEIDNLWAPVVAEQKLPPQEFEKCIISTSSDVRLNLFVKRHSKRSHKTADYGMRILLYIQI